MDWRAHTIRVCITTTQEMWASELREDYAAFSGWWDSAKTTDDRVRVETSIMFTDIEYVARTLLRWYDKRVIEKFSFEYSGE